MWKKRYNVEWQSGLLFTSVHQFFYMLDYLCFCSSTSIQSNTRSILHFCSALAQFQQCWLPLRCFQLIISVIVRVPLLYLTQNCSDMQWPSYLFLQGEEEGIAWRVTGCFQTFTVWSKWSNTKSWEAWILFLVLLLTCWVNYLTSVVVLSLLHVLLNLQSCSVCYLQWDQACPKKQLACCGQYYMFMRSLFLSFKASLTTLDSVWLR